MSSEGTLDKRRVRAHFTRAATEYDAHAVLQHEVGARLNERLDVIKLAPARILDAGCGTGRGTLALQQRYPRADIIALDLAPAMVVQTRRHTPSRWFKRARVRYVAGDIEQLPLAAQCCDLVYSNLALQWMNNLDAACAELRRVLTPGGLLMFTSFGPDTLRELREAWRAVDDAPHINTFIDMHDVGDALTRAGFSGPVLDVEHFTLTYPDARAVMRDLRAIGARNATVQRARGLTGKARLAAVYTAYERWRRADGLLPANFEVVYGHAWAPSENAPARHDGVTRVPLSRLQRR